MTMIKMLDVKPKKGEIGIEIELEGDGLPREGTKHWRIENDGSLRGQAVEMVLKSPVKRQHVDGALLEFTKTIDGARIEDSGRAGIHIHINIQELTPRELAQFMCLYLVFENTLVEWCGSSRVGNLFCLRCEDAPGLLDILVAAFKGEEWEYLNTDEIRYASMNAKAVCTYGSLEFRAMRGTADTKAIKMWVNMLLAIKDHSKTFKSPMDIVEGMSLKGTEGFFMDALGRFKELKFRNSDMMTGVRNAQSLAYSRGNWDELEAKMYDYEGLDVVQDEEAHLNALNVNPGHLNVDRHLRVDPEQAFKIPKHIRDMNFKPGMVVRPEWVEAGAQGVMPEIDPRIAGMNDEEVADYMARRAELGLAPVNPPGMKIPVRKPAVDDGGAHVVMEGDPMGPIGRKVIEKNNETWYLCKGRDGENRWLNEKMIFNTASTILTKPHHPASVGAKLLLRSFLEGHWWEIRTGEHRNIRLPHATIKRARALLHEEDRLGNLKADIDGVDEDDLDEILKGWDGEIE